MRGGFVMLDNDVEINCTFETLVRLQREKLEKQVAQVCSRNNAGARILIREEGYLVPPKRYGLSLCLRPGQGHGKPPADPGPGWTG